MKAFTNYLQTECGLAGNTVSAYVSDLHLFESWLSRQCGSFDLYTFDHLHVSAFVQESGHAVATVRRRVAAIRVWLKFQQMNGRNVAHTLANIDRPKADKKLPTIIGRLAVEKLIASASDARGLAVLELLYAAGLRASELCGLTKANIDLRGKYVRVFGKGGKERYVPITKAAAQAIVRYYATRTDKLGFAFEHNGQQLSRRELHRIVKAAWIASGIAQKVSPHTLRHCFASHLIQGRDAVEISGQGGVAVNLESGAVDVRIVQELMGHDSVNTTAIYLHTDIKRLKRTHALLGH